MFLGHQRPPLPLAALPPRLSDPKSWHFLINPSHTSQKPRVNIGSVSFSKSNIYLIIGANTYMPGTIVSTLHVSVYSLQQGFTVNATIIIPFLVNQSREVIIYQPVSGHIASKWEIRTHCLPIKISSYFPMSSFLSILGKLK